MATVCTLLWTRSMSEATPRGAKRAAPAPAPARSRTAAPAPPPARLATDLRRLHALPGRSHCWQLMIWLGVLADR